MVSSDHYGSDTPASVEDSKMAFHDLFPVKASTWFFRSFILQLRETKAW